MNPLILQTKLIAPRTRAGLVERPALDQQLNQATSHPLTLVNAPAGFGKTTLVAQWTTAQQTPFCWLALDESDNSPQQFWRYIVAALQTVHAGWGRAAQAMLQQSGRASWQAVAGSLTNDILSSAERVIFVLDDYQLINNADIHSALAFWLTHFPPNLHLILCSRQAPPLPLARLRASGRMQTISADNLRFNHDESAEFLQQTMGLTLSADQSHLIIGQTEGWAAGLQLAALAQQINNKRVIPPDQSHMVWDYLLEEVFSQLDPNQQQFLVKTAFLDRLNADLCDAVLSRTDSRQQLRALEKNNLFLVALDDDWYRLHHLFHAFLHTQASDDARPRQKAAARWFASQNSMGAAIENGLAGQDFVWVTAQIVQQADALWTRGEVGQLQQWLDRVPSTHFERQPLLTLYAAWNLFFMGQFQAVLDLLEQVDGLLVGQAASPQARGMLDAIRTGVAGGMGDPHKAIVSGKRALAALPKDNLIWRSVVAISLATAYQQIGRIGDALPLMQTGADLAERGGNLWGALFVLGNLAGVYVERGEWDSAEKTFRHGLDLTLKTVGALLPISGLMAAGLGMLLLQKGQLAEAEHYLVDGIRLSEQGGFARSEFYDALANLRERQGQPEVAAQLRQKAQTVQQAPMDAALASRGDSGGTNLAEVLDSAEIPQLIEPLSDRELEILTHIAAGKSNQAIADELFVALSTIKWHINNIYGKLNVSRRTQAVARARDLMLVR